MDELEVLRRVVTKQGNRIATLSVDLDLAYAQIDILQEQLKEKAVETKAE